MGAPAEIVRAVDLYEALRVGPLTREKILAHGALMWLLRRRGSPVDHGGLRYSYDRQDDCVARVLVEVPRAVDGRKLPRKPTHDAADARRAIHLPRSDFRRGNGRTIF